MTDARSGSVSVVIPTYNRADLLPRAIESALGQSRAPDEVIVVDDGSTDDTAARCAAWRERIRYVRIPNSGVSAARNAGLDLASGDWVGLLDSDDVWEREKLEVQLAAAREMPEAEWIVSGCVVVDGSGRPQDGLQGFERAFPLFREFGLTPEKFFGEHLRQHDFEASGKQHVCYTGDFFELLFFGNVALPSSALMRRTFLSRTGGFDATLRVAEETEFFHRAAAYGPGAVIMSPLVRYRAAQSDSLTAGRNVISLIDAALASIEAAARRRPLSPAERRALEIGRKSLLLRLAYAYLSVHDGRAVRRTLGRLRSQGLRLGTRGTALWTASLLPAPVLGALHAGKKTLGKLRAA